MITLLRHGRDLVHVPKGFLAKVRSSPAFKRIKKFRLGTNPDTWDGTEITDEQVLAAYPESKRIRNSRGELEGQVSEFVGARFSVAPHHDRGVKGRWSNFLICHSDGLRVNTLPVNNRIDEPDIEGELVSLNIYETHWLEPCDGYTSLRPPYMWIGLTLQSNKPIPQENLSKLFAAHLANMPKTLPIKYK